MAYYLVSVSNRTNLELCKKYALAGFTNSINGLWTFLEIEKDDYISFLYGARVHNLYKVVEKAAFENAENLPPWPPVTFRMSGRTYYFPFRLFLKQERKIDEPMVRPEFAYVAENLLLRGGYRKTHFQADTVTFYSVSTMGQRCEDTTERLEIDGSTFIPEIVFDRKNQSIPHRFHFQELILQSMVRKKLSQNQNEKLKPILEALNIHEDSIEFEILGEKALPEGHVDIFIKNKHPSAKTTKIIVEVKVGKAQYKNIEQLLSYMKELGEECRGGVLITKDFSNRMLYEKPENIVLVKYSLDGIERDGSYTYQQLLDALNLEIFS